MPALMQLVSFSTFRPVSQWICFCFWLAASGCRVYMQNFSTALHACRVYIQKFSAALHGCRMKIKKILGRLMVCGCICRTSPQHSIAHGCIYKSSLQHSLDFRKTMECCGGLAHIPPNLIRLRLKNRKSKQGAWSAPENFAIYTRASCIAEIPEACREKIGYIHPQTINPEPGIDITRRSKLAPCSPPPPFLSARRFRLRVFSSEFPLQSSRLRVFPSKSK